MRILDYDGWRYRDDNSYAFDQAFKIITFCALDDSEHVRVPVLLKTLRSRGEPTARWVGIMQRQGGYTDPKESFDESRTRYLSEQKDPDPVNHPAHYTAYPGVEVIQLTEHMNFCRGNAVKYIARAAFKGTELQDLEKAAWYIQREIERVKNAGDLPTMGSEDAMEQGSVRPAQEGA